MNGFFRCPYKWDLINIVKAPCINVQNDKGLLGQNIHSIIAEYYRLVPQHPTSKQIESLATTCFTQMFESFLSHYKHVAEDMVKNFIKFEQSRLKNYVKPILVEKTLEDDLFKGVIDFFDGQNIIDWKTGAMCNLDDDSRRQGKIYDLLLQHNGFNNGGKNFKVFFVTLRNSRVLELPFTSEAWLMDQIKHMYSIIQSGRFPKIRSPLCDWCEVELYCQLEDTHLWESVLNKLS